MKVKTNDLKERALEARLGPALLLHHYGKVDALTDTEQEGLEQIEKLAELIVKKCVSIVAARKDQAIEDGCNVDEAMSAAETDLLEHFGVEE
jgi:hypothetical protein